MSYSIPVFIFEGVEIGKDGHLYKRKFKTYKMKWISKWRFNPRNKWMNCIEKVYYLVDA